MMKKIVLITLEFSLLACLLAGCGGTTTASSAAEQPSAAASTLEAALLEDGIYDATFETDSSMFGVNEVCNGIGTLTVQDGKMAIHITLRSKKILNLYLGLAADAQKDGAALLEPTTDAVTYPDGITEEVYGFDVPIPAIGTEFDLALIGRKGVWYDHKVSVQNPVPQTKTVPELADGSYSCAVLLEGGSGRAAIESPAVLTVQNGAVTARIVWDSAHYDYMKIGETKYLPVNTEGNSTFELPVTAWDTALAVVANTIAMSTPHEIAYTLTFDSNSLQVTE